MFSEDVAKHLTRENHGLFWRHLMIMRRRMSQCIYWGMYNIAFQ